MNVDVLDRVSMPDPRVSAAGADVKLQGVTKSFGDHRVLHGIDLDDRSRASSLPSSAAAAAANRRCCG